MTNHRESPIEISKEEFKQIGHELIDTIAGFIDTIPGRPVTTGASPAEVQAILGNNPLPENGQPASTILSHAADLLTNHSLLNGHPKFLGYITSSPGL
jgi:aromatic-L-amino-acid decarboxylase